MSKTFNNFVAKYMHTVHRPMVEANKRNKMLDDLAELEQNETYFPEELVDNLVAIKIDRGNRKVTEVRLPKARVGGGRMIFKLENN